MINKLIDLNRLGYAEVEDPWTVSKLQVSKQSDENLGESVIINRMNNPVMLKSFIGS